MSPVWCEFVHPSEVEEAEELVKEEAQAEGEELKQPAEGEEPLQTIAEAIPDHELDPAYAAFVRAAAINEILIESDMDDLPGGFLRMISVTDDSVTLRRVWQRGLAAGSGDRCARPDPGGRQGDRADPAFEQHGYPVAATTDAASPRS